MSTTARTLVIARVLPIVSDVDFNADDSKTEYNVTKPKRKRQRLDHLSEEQKLNRRKMKNRVAAQSARDRKKVKMSELEAKINNLVKQRNVLLSCNETLANKYNSIEKENRELKERLCQLESSKLEQNSVCLRCENSIKSAELINVPQLKEQESNACKQTLNIAIQLMMPWIYLLMIMNVMQFLIFYKNVPKNFSQTQNSRTDRKEIMQIYSKARQLSAELKSCNPPNS